MRFVIGSGRRERRSTNWCCAMCPLRVRVALAGIALAAMLVLPAAVYAQTTVSTGSIQGTVLDQTGAVVSTAKITITNRDTAQIIRLVTTSTGTYASGSLAPGSYVVRVESEGFKTAELSVIVQVGVTSAGNIQLHLGQPAQVIEVHDSDVRVNTEQAIIQGVLTRQQIETLPINGRNFIDLAQLEPGIQTQDTSDSETHLSRAGISVGGQYSGSTRVEVDGIDLSDGTGNSLSNISSSSIQEFSITQSSADPSSEATSTGGVNIVTRTGGNTPHGEALYLFRDKSLASNFPGAQDPPYQRHDLAGSLGGPIIKDKLFFFVNGERYKQDLGFPVNPPPPLDALSSVVNEPLRETMLSGRLDYNAPKGLRLFYKFNYDNTKTVGAFQPTFSIQREVNNAPTHVAGADFSTGRFAHSIRFGYVKSQDLFEDATSEPGVFDPFPGVTLNFGRLFHAGAEPNEPSADYQSNKQIKYDGSVNVSSHIVRYGISYSRVQLGQFFNFAGLGPIIKSQITQDNVVIADAGPFPGGSHNPLNYPVFGNLSIQLGNGNGFTTEIPAFGLPAGGAKPDNRIQWYVGDAWKIRPYLTLNYSLRYVRDTGVGNSDLAAIPCSALDTTTFNPPPTCNGNLLDMFGSGLGQRVRQDNNNFAPQIGFAWDLFKNGKTVLRAGAGIAYASSNPAIDRTKLLPTGLFNFVASSNNGQGCDTGQFRFPSGGGGFTTVTQTPPTAAHPGGLDIASQVCGQPIGSVAADIKALDLAYKAAWAAAGTQSNPNFIGNTLDPTGLLAPDYRTPYSYQMNLGMQHEVRNGVVVSADYVRNVSLHYLLGVDVNHVGDSRYLNKTAALNAIGVTNASFGCPAGVAGIDCSIAAGATMEDFAGSGVTSTTLSFGVPPSFNGVGPDQGASFAGINPEVG